MKSKMFYPRNLHKYCLFILSAYVLLIWIHLQGNTYTKKTSESKSRYGDGRVFNLQGITNIVAKLSVHGDNFVDPQSRDAPRPVIVMASSRSFFRSTLGTIASIQYHLPKEKIVLYDIGLLKRQRRTVKYLCNVELRRVKFSMYPFHVRILRTYAWKPIVLQMALQEFGAILWLERSMIVTTSQSKYDSVVNQAKGPGILLLGGRKPSSVLHYTHPDMLEYLPLHSSTSRYSFQSRSSPVLIYNTKRVHDHFMKWLVFCALDRNCIAPFGGKRRYCRYRHGIRSTSLRRYKRHCHRFDQSAMNILLVNMFGAHNREYISHTRLGVRKWDSSHFHRLKRCVPKHM